VGKNVGKPGKLVANAGETDEKRGKHLAKHRKNVEETVTWERRGKT
jgi:hypothetical protein